MENKNFPDLNLLEWGENPMTEPKKWDKNAKKRLLDDHRLLHIHFNNIKKGKKLYHRIGELAGKPVTLSWIIKFHNWIVKHMVELGFKHYIRDDLDRTLPKELKDKSIQEHIQLRDIFYNQEQELKDALTTVDAESLLPQIIGKDVPKWAKFLPTRHAQLVWNGQKDLMLSKIKFKHHIKEDLLLSDNKFVYGVIYIDFYDEIKDKEQFDQLKNRHCVTDDELKSWWNSEFPLYGYNINIVKMFPNPTKMKRIRGFQQFIETKKIKIPKQIANEIIDNMVKEKEKITKMVDDLVNTLITDSYLSNDNLLQETISKLADITPDNLKKVSNEQLMFLHILIHKMFNSKERIKRNSPSTEFLVHIHLYIVREMKSRKMKHIKRDKLDKLTEEFLKGSLDIEMGYKKDLKDALKNVKDIVLVNDYISLVGSSVSEYKEPDDIDILIRDEVRDQNVELKIARVLREGGVDPKKIHFIWYPKGPNSDYVKLGDLIIRFDKSFPLIKVKEDRYKNIKKDIVICPECGTEFDYDEQPECPNCNDIIDQELVEDTGGKTESVDNLAESFEPFRPFKNFTPPKPAMKGITEAFSIKDIEDWVDKNIGRKLDVEEKLNGFRTIIEKLGNKYRIYFEDIKEDKSNQLPELVEVIKDIPDDFTFDCEIGIMRNGKKLSRIQLMVLLANKPELKENDVVVCTGFDLPYWKESLVNKPLIERRKLLEEFYKKYLSKSEHFKLTSFNIVETKEELKKKVRELSQVDGSEGVVIKAIDSKYRPGGLPDWAKIKKAVEIKAIVLDKQINKNNTYSYYGGVYPGDTDFKNITEFRGEKYINLGKTMSTKIDAQVGDIITCQIEELMITKENKLAWTISRVMDIDRERNKPYFANQSIDIARRGGVLQEYKQEYLDITKPIQNRVDEMKVWINEALKDEDEPRSNIAKRFWKENWYKLYPQSGSGRFVLQQHWRGLSREESKMSRDELLKTDNSVHGDLRLQFDKNYCWGFTVFYGTVSDVRKHGGDRVIGLKENEKLQGEHKLLIPIEWLDLKDGYVSDPGEVGSTTKAWAKFFVIDKGIWTCGVWRAHFQEIFLDGSKLKGRYIISFAPVGNKRIWLLSKPADQTPYADTHNKDDVIKELKAKNQKYLIWAKPGQKPELIDIDRYKI